MDHLQDSVQEESIDIRDFLLKMLGYWHYFVISLIVAIMLAFLINRVTTRVYQIKTTLLVQEEQSMLDAKFAVGMNLYNSSYRLYNEIGILKSYTLTQRALKHLDFTVGYYTSQHMLERELYHECPFRVVLDSTTAQPLFTEIHIEILSPEKFKVTADGRNVSLYNFSTRKSAQIVPEFRINTEGVINNEVKTDQVAFTLFPAFTADLKNYVGRSYYIRIFNEPYLINRYRALDVSETKNSSIVTVSIQGNNVEKLVDFLNTLTREYLIKGLEKKNQIAENTIRFIDMQLGEVTDSLSYSEKVLQDYRANNYIMNVDFQTQQVFTALENLKNQRAELVVQSKYYDYLKKFLIENRADQDLIVPSSLGIQDPVINNLINELTQLLSERTELMINSKKENPYIASIDSRIAAMKKTILENIENLINASKISINDIDSRIEESSKQVNKMPETQRKLFGYERKFKLNDALYTYLLTKRSETQIAKASYLPDNEVLDKATDTEYTLVSPKTRRNYIIAFILGLGLPVAFLLLIDFFNDKVNTSEDIEAITDYPVLGHIIHSKDKSYTVVNDYPLSLTTESFRAIRTNFQFIASEGSHPIILISSTMMGEGKSYTSLNLALSFALYNKKTVLINFDMRKPKLGLYLNMNVEKGLSSLLSKNATLDEVIAKTQFENLDIIVAGTIPPNPMELIAGPVTGGLFAELKKRYDYVIVDTPPVGMVADALLLVKYSDVNLFVVRYNHTQKKVFARLVQSINKRGVGHLNIVLNDVYIGRKYQNYAQGYAYGYGYGYGYSQENGAKKLKKSKSVSTGQADKS